MKRSTRSLLICVLAMAIGVLAGGCGGSRAIAPVGRAHGASHGARTVHVVKQGESLYTIAMMFDLDYLLVARSNGLSDPFVVHPGQRLTIPERGMVKSPRLNARKTRAVTPAPGTTSSAPTPLPPKEATDIRSSERTAGERNTRARPRSESLEHASVSWQWPTKGLVVTSFIASGKKGIDIAGRVGQPVRAAASGKVVYSGSGLRGYGKLIIVKHNKRFLSAYAHNDRVLAKEGYSVKAGQRIAQMGRTEDGRSLLHFEIRRDGKPVDPGLHLP